MDSLDRLERLFRAAQMHAPEEQAAFLDAACADDPALRRELEDLLQADGQADAEDFLDSPPLPGWTTPLRASPGAAGGEGMDGQRIGPFVVLRQLGHGGMGDVFLAVREQPFKQYVALKIIRQGMNSREVVARFAVERQILAALNHPNIARLIDGGMTDEGLPYFAMEYVNGKPITDYCDDRRLSLQERLRLFQKVCHAVQYAHQNLVIHRDLKPTNILVTEDGTVKLLDFGIAKLLNPHLSPVDMPVTRAELRLMTPEYASPEQVRGESLTTAADVYALGVLLYELLTGHRPYRVAGRPTHEVISIVCEQQPERPSTRISKAETLTQPDGTDKVITPDTVSATRGMPMERLRRQIRGDLDNITLMALRKEQERRYGSAEQLGLDIERYLAGLPVVARPNTLGYRARKFVMRHRAVAVATLLVVLSLVGGLATALWQAGEARRALVRAEQALGQSEEVSGFLMSLFKASDPSVALGVEVSARELLERGVSRAEELAGQPMIQAQMLDVIGQVYQNLGQYDNARQLLDRALELRSTHAGAESVEAATSRAHLANVFRFQAHYPEAESLYQQALDVHRRVLGDVHPQVAESLIGLGLVLQSRGDFDRAEVVLREALAIQENLYSEEHPEVLATQSRLAMVLHGKGDYDAAEAILKRTLALREEIYGPFHSDVAQNLIQMASLYATRDGDFQQSEALHRRALEIRERMYGSEHPEVAKSLIYVGNSLLFQGKYAEAEPLLRQALVMNQRLLGETHPDVGTAFNTLALLLERRGAHDEAEVFFRKALENYEGAFGEEHHYTAAVIGNLGDLAHRRGDLQTAEAFLRKDFAIRQKTLGDNHPYTVGVQRKLASVLRQREQFEEAETLLKDALANYQQRTATNEIQEVYSELVLLYQAWGNLEQEAHYQALVVEQSAEH